MMYQSSVCRGHMRQRRPPREVYGPHYCGSQRLCPFQRMIKFDPLSLHGGLHGLSFDPANAQALLSAVSALRSTQDQCTISDPTPLDLAPSFSNPSSSNNSDTNSFTRPATPPPIIDFCPSHAHGRKVQSIACESSGSHTPVDVDLGQPEKDLFDRGEFLRERILQERFLEETRSCLQQERCPKKGNSELNASQLRVGTKSSTMDGKSPKHRKDLTWIDWGWPGTHVACPFNLQRHLELDDSLIRPELISEQTNFFKSWTNCCKLLGRHLCAPTCCCEREVMASTAVDVKELATSYVFVADMPGLKNTDVKVQVENDNVLRISGERRREDAVQDGEVKYVRVERSAGKFMRKFNLPANANLDAITAACQDGLLTIIVPKTPPPDIYRPRTFDVNVSSTDLGKA